MTLTQKKILITGATGFLGSHLCERLVADNELTLLVLPGDPLVNMAAIKERLKIVPADLTDRAALRKIIKDVAPQYVFHLAANTSQARELAVLPEMLASNLTPTINLIQALAGIPLERFITLGTSDIYGAAAAPLAETLSPSPVSPYAVTKAASLLFTRFAYLNYGLPAVMLIPFMVYGPRQSPKMFISQAIRAALAGEDFPMTAGEQAREFNYVGDVIGGIIAGAVAPGVVGQTINICGGERLTVYEAALAIWRLTEAKGNILRGALPYRAGENMAHYGDLEKALIFLNYRPATSFTKGLQATIAYWQAQLK